MNSRTHLYLAGSISVAETAYPCGTPGFNLGFSVVRVARYFVFCIVFCRSLFIRWAFFLLTIVLSVLVRFTASDYLFSILNFLSKGRNKICMIALCCGMPYFLLLVIHLTYRSHFITKLFQFNNFLQSFPVTNGKVNFKCFTKRLLDRRDVLCTINYDNISNVIYTIYTLYIKGLIFIDCS